MADFDSKYSGEQVEALLDQVASGNAGGGGGGITVETDPIFSNSPAASITEDDIRGWNNDHAVVEDLNIDVAQLIQDVEDKQDALVSGENIKTINGESILGSGDIPAASTSKYGVTKLSSATNSTSTTLAATPSAVKAAYDLAAGKASMSDVNTAIANAITNVINASY